MKITIKGDGVTPERIAEALRKCEQDHGLKIKGATIYLRMEDHLGRMVEPLRDGYEISRDFTFRKPRQINMPQSSQEFSGNPPDPITARDMMELCQKQARRTLSAPEMTTLITIEKTIKPERNEFVQALRQSVAQVGRFSINHLEQLISKKDCTLK